MRAFNDFSPLLMLILSCVTFSTMASAAPTHMVWNIDPEIIRIGFFRPRWYGLMFIVGFTLGYQLIRYMWRQEGWDLAPVEKGLHLVIFATFVGARLAHCLFYRPEHYLNHPLEILAFWEGGFASHGGVVGVALALVFYQLRYRNEGHSLLQLLDRVMLGGVLLGGFVRLGNFCNSEIYGKVTDVPWAVVFQRRDLWPRHPTQLYEATGCFAIFLLLLLLYRTTNIRRFQGSLFGLLMVLVCGMRFVVEFLKENQVGFEDGLVLNLGQLLSLPFFLIGLLLIFFNMFRLKHLRCSDRQETPSSSR